MQMSCIVFSIGFFRNDYCRVWSGREEHRDEHTYSTAAASTTTTSSSSASSTAPTAIFFAHRICVCECGRRHNLWVSGELLNGSAYRGEWFTVCGKWEPDLHRRMR